jgi:delta14-sterol reductase
MGITATLAIYGIVFLLYLVVPGRWVEGYVTDDRGQRLRYHLNGLYVFVLAIAAWFFICQRGLVEWDFLYQHRYQTLATAFVIGIVFTFAIVLPLPKVKSLGADLYLGRAKNPQWGRADAKMFLYLIGAVMLELNLLSFGAHHWLKLGPSPGVILHIALFSFFLVEYLFFENVHLYTYDFVAERVGFKLGWGCLVFYPFFYAIGLWFAADAPNRVPNFVLVLAAILFLAGWTFARGANLQKFYFKTGKQLGPIPQRALENRVLVSGFWGLSRHINYLGELCMASGLALCLGHPAAWLYPLYYVALLVPRQIADDKRCADKYGALWEEYCREVPYRIIPFIY